MGEINGVVHESIHESKIEAVRASDAFLIKHGTSSDRFRINFSDSKKYPHEHKYTDLHLALKHGNEEIVHTFLKIFGTEKTKMAIAYFLKKEEYTSTEVHDASKSAHKAIVESLTILFSEEEKAKLIEYLVKTNNKFSSLGNI